MRRIDREIKNLEEIVDVLERCDTIRLGLLGEEYPYVLPLSFGYEVQAGKLLIYIHGAGIGEKHDRIAECNRVCVEADICYGFKETPQGITTLYESMIGFGRIETIEDREARHGLDLILEHANYRDYAYDERALSMTTVHRIRLEKVTGKRNRP